MVKNLFLSTKVSSSLSKCTIEGNYYLINSSNNKIKVRIKLDSSDHLLEQSVEIKSSKRTQKKIEFSAHEKMNSHPFTIDLLSSTLNFELKSNHIAHLDINNISRNIGNIQIIENGTISDFDEKKAKFESRDFMEYVMLYNHE